MNRPVLIVGATSGIGRECAMEFARRGHPLILAARDEEEMARIAADINIRFDQMVETVAYDADEPGMGERMAARMNAIDLEGVVWLVGDLGDQDTAQEDRAHAEKILRRNYAAAVEVLHPLALQFESQGHGFIIGVGSVAGDRGRAKNYVYGAAKSALAEFLSGLRQRLAGTGVRVITIKPGFVDTAMTFGLGKMPLLASPKDVGRRIATAAFLHRDVVYVPAPWRLVMFVIRSLPEAIFKRVQI